MEQQSKEKRPNVLFLSGEEVELSPPLRALLDQRYNLRCMHRDATSIDHWKESGATPDAVVVECVERCAHTSDLLRKLEVIFPSLPVVRLEGGPERDLSNLIAELDGALHAVTSLEVAANRSPAPITVSRLSAGEYTRWDQFVLSCPAATFYHRSGWKRILEDVYRHEAPYLYAEQAGQIVGVLPLGHIRSRVFDNALISTPFCVYGGVATEDDRVRVALEEEACRLAERLGVDYLEMRQRQVTNSEWPRKNLHVTFRKALAPDPETNLNQIPRKQRRMVRLGIEAGLSGEYDGNVDRFYELYAESVRNLGTPVHAKRYFSALKEVFGDDCDILTITHQGRPLSSVMSFYFRDEVAPYYGGGGAEAREKHANDFMYWELMKRSCERGYRTFDFGRSKKGVGSYSFKKHWGFDETPLQYEFHLVSSKELPDQNPLNPKYRLFIAGWRKLPLSVSIFLGPFLAKDLG